MSLRVMLMLVVLFPLLCGCFASADAVDPITLGHAAWCGTSPPSGYCIIPESD